MTIAYTTGKPSVEEQKREIQLIEEYANKNKCEVVKTQIIGNDDYGADGIIKFKKDGRPVNVEARFKGYKLRSDREATKFPNGWETGFLKDGIFLNRSTIAKYVNSGFLFLVKIIDCEPRRAIVEKEQVVELLKQRGRSMRSANTGNFQNVIPVPLDLFVEYKSDLDFNPTII